MVKGAALFAAISWLLAVLFQIVNFVSVSSRTFRIPAVLYLAVYGLAYLSVGVFMICLFAELDKSRPRR
jgi:hypothetical protein